MADANIQKLINTSPNTDYRSFSANSDDVGDNLRSSKNKSFGVYETKQVVKETMVPPSQVAETVSQTDPTALANLEAKTGTTIETDLQLDNAVRQMSQQVSDTQQAGFDARFNSDITVGSATVPAEHVINTNVIDEVNENYTSDPELRELIPESMTVSEFEKFKETMVKQLDPLNSCPNLRALLNKLHKMSPVSDLFSSLFSIFGLVGKYDVKGVLNCIANVQRQLTTMQRAGLTKLLIDQGSLNGINDITRTASSNGNFIDKYDDVRRMGRSRSVRRDPKTRLPFNTFRNPEVKATADETFTAMGVDKSQVYAAQTNQPAANPSLVNKVNEPVYDVREIQAVDRSTGFTEYTTGSNDALLRGVPLTSSMFG